MKQNEEVSKEKLSKKAIFIICLLIVIQPIIFWFIFGIVAYQRFDYDFEQQNACYEETQLLYEREGIKYYTTDCIKDLDVIEIRFLFRVNKGSLKQYIKEKNFYQILNKLDKFKYAGRSGIATIYSSDKTNITIVKCEVQDDKLKEEYNYEYYIGTSVTERTCDYYH